MQMGIRTATMPVSFGHPVRHALAYIVRGNGRSRLHISLPWAATAPDIPVEVCIVVVERGRMLAERDSWYCRADSVRIHHGIYWFGQEWIGRGSNRRTGNIEVKKSRRRSRKSAYFVRLEMWALVCY